MSTTTAKRSTPKRASSGGSLLSRIIFGAFLLMILAAVGTLILLIFGRCTGEEFSSTDFSRRTFYYFRIPLVKFQVTPLVRTDKSSVLVNYLQTNQLIPQGKKKWKLASHRVGGSHPYEADELILARYLEQRNNGYDLRWLKWSQNNPKLARAFWPIVWRVANEDLYVLIPELFQLARYSPDPVALDRELRTLIINDGSRIAAGEYQLGNYQRAAQIAAFAIAVAGSETDGNSNTGKSWDESFANAAREAVEIQFKAVKEGAEPVPSESLPEFDPNAPEPDPIPLDDRDETEPVEPDDEPNNEEADEAEADESEAKSSDAEAGVSDDAK